MARRGRCAPARSTAKSPTAFAANGAPRSTPISDPSSKPHGENRSEPSTPSASPSEAAPSLAQLENANGDLSNYGKWFQTTLKGNQLKNVKFTRRISRVRAEEIVNAFLQRCAEVNKSDYYLCTVQKVVAFGSYVSESPDLGDIDLVISLKRKD